MSPKVLFLSLLLCLIAAQTEPETPVAETFN